MSVAIFSIFVSYLFIFLTFYFGIYLFILEPSFLSHLRLLGLTRILEQVFVCLFMSWKLLVELLSFHEKSESVKLTTAINTASRSQNWEKGSFYS